MRKLQELIQRWIQRRRDSRGRYLVIYLDRDMETIHRFKFADIYRAKKTYEFLKGIITSVQAPGMVVGLYHDGLIIEQYDTVEGTGFEEAQMAFERIVQTK